jgi:hypothetical protein
MGFIFGSKQALKSLFTSDEGIVTVFYLGAFGPGISFVETTKG